MADMKLWLQGCPVGESCPSLQQGLIIHLEVIDEPQRVDVAGDDRNSLLDTRQVLRTRYGSCRQSRKRKTKADRSIHKAQIILSIREWHVLFESIPVFLVYLAETVKGRYQPAPLFS